MSVITYEGTVENGQIRLPGNVRLPEKARVYVVVPGVEPRPVIHGPAPRLAHPEQSADFRKEVIMEPSDAGL